MCGTGPSGPPRNSVTTMADMVIMFMNSARKKRAKRIDEYSVLNPPTSSESASTRSKGGRLSSAVMATMNKKNGTMPSRIRFQSQKPCGLGVDDGPGRQRPGDEDDRDHDHAQGGLVGDHLGRGPHRPEQRVLRPRRPAGQHHAVDRDRRHGQHEQDADRGVGHLQLEGVAGDGDDPAHGHHGEDQEGRQQRQVGRQLEHERVGPLGEQVLLEEELDPVGQGLEQPPGPGPVGPDPALHVRDDLALEPDHEHDRHQQDAEGHQHLDDDDQPARPSRPRGRRGGRWRPGAPRRPAGRPPIHRPSPAALTASPAARRSRRPRRRSARPRRWRPTRVRAAGAPDPAGAGRLKSTATTPRARSASATAGSTTAPRGERTRTRSPRSHAEAVEVVGVGPQLARADERAERGRAATRRPAVVEAAAGDQAQRVAVGTGTAHAGASGSAAGGGTQHRRGDGGSGPVRDGPLGRPASTPPGGSARPTRGGAPWRSTDSIPGVAMGSIGARRCARPTRRRAAQRARRRRPWRPESRTARVRPR